MGKLALAVAVCVVPSVTIADTYCYSQYRSRIQNANAQLASNLDRTEIIQARLQVIIPRMVELATEIADLSSQIPLDTAKLQALGMEVSALNREKVELEAEAYALQDQAFALRNTVPADLSGRLRGCVEATAPADQLVNLTIQALAFLSTGGASLALPEKALYVDMAAVLNGYPTGGDKSVINEARQAALDAFGIGDENNDLGNLIKNPIQEVGDFIDDIF